MKIKILTLLALCLSLAACEKEQGGGGGGDQPKPVDPPAPEGYTRLYLPCETLDETKTTLSDGKIKWKVGDRVMINGYSFSVSVNEDGSATVEVPKADTYKGFYPADIVGEKEIFLQPMQYYANGSVGPKAYPSSAQGSTDTLAFKSLCGILHLKVHGKGDVASIRITDKGGAKLCGSWPTDSEFMSEGSLSGSGVTLNCKTMGNAAVALKAAGTDFYIVLPPGEYAGGFNVNISDANNTAYQFDLAGPVSITKGHVTSFTDINFAPAENQIYSFHFDNMVFGGDPVAEKRGFSCGNPSSPRGFEYSNAVADVSVAGSAIMAATTTSSDRSLPVSYYYSRNIYDFKSLHQTQEFAGYVGIGVNGNPQGTFKLPAMSNIPEGKVCKAVITFKMALQKNHSANPIGLLHTYTSPGKILALWVDGVKVAYCDYVRTALTGSMGDDSRWSSQDGETGIQPATLATERVLVKTSDLPGYTWHEIKLEMGAVTPKTVIEFHPQPASGVSSAYFIDDVEACWVDYNLPDKAEILPFSYIVSPSSTTAISRLSSFGPSIGMEKYTDISLGTSVFMDKNDNFLADATIESRIKTYVSNIEGAGYKVWNIHLPATTYAGSYNGNIFEYFHYDTATRQAAVNRMKKILKFVKPFKSVNLMVHATGPGRSSTDTRYSFENAKDNGVASFQELVDYCNSGAMAYPDGSHPVFCIENIQNTGTTAANVCAKAEYMNYYCSQVPGLKVCFDSSHAQVCEGEGGETAMEYLKILGTNLACLHMHGNGRTNKDCHIMPGYKDGLGYDYGLSDIMDWGLMYKILLEDCKYRGVFTYEGGNSYKDQIWNYSTIADNYYGYVLGEYMKQK